MLGVSDTQSQGAASCKCSGVLSERCLCAMAFTCCSSDAREQLRVSEAIDLQLEQWKRDENREFKVLVVGVMAVLQYLYTLAGHR